MFWQSLLQKTSDLFVHYRFSDFIDNVGYQILTLILTLSHHHCHIGYQWVLSQYCFYFSQLDPISAYLYLLIDSSKIFDVAVGQVSRKISCPVKSRSLLLAERVRYELSLGQFRIIQIISSKANASNTYFSWN